MDRPSRIVRHQALAFLVRLWQNRQHLSYKQLIETLCGKSFAHDRRWRSGTRHGQFQSHRRPLCMVRYSNLYGRMTSAHGPSLRAQRPSPCEADGNKHTAARQDKNAQPGGGTHAALDRGLAFYACRIMGARVQRWIRLTSIKSNWRSCGKKTCMLLYVLLLLLFVRVYYKKQNLRLTNPTWLDRCEMLLHEPLAKNCCNHPSVAFVPQLCHCYSLAPYSTVHVHAKTGKANIIASYVSSSLRCGRQLCIAFLALIHQHAVQHFYFHQPVRFVMLEVLTSAGDAASAVDTVGSGAGTCAPACMGFYRDVFSFSQRGHVLSSAIETIKGNCHPRS